MDALSRLAVTFILNALWQVTLIAVLALAVDRFLRHAAKLEPMVALGYE